MDEGGTKAIKPKSRIGGTLTRQRAPVGMTAMQKKENAYACEMDASNIRRTARSVAAQKQANLASDNAMGDSCGTKASRPKAKQANLASDDAMSAGTNASKGDPSSFLPFPKAAMQWTKAPSDGR